MFVFCAARMSHRSPSRCSSQEKRPLRGARGFSIGVEVAAYRPTQVRQPEVWPQRLSLHFVVLPNAVMELRRVHGGMHAFDFEAAFPVTAQHVDEVDVLRQQRRHARHVVRIPGGLPLGGDGTGTLFEGCGHGCTYQFSKPA